MINYTLRVAATVDPVAAREDTLEAAVDHLDRERLAFLLDSPNEPRELELVITADEITGEQGRVILRFVAGLHRDSQT